MKRLRTRQSLRPGQPGTRSLLRRFGNRLVRVRYLDDPASGRHLKTVELIVDEWDWPPPRPARDPGQIVALRIAWEEAELQGRVKSAGGRWNPTRRVWEVRYAVAERLGLAGRIVGG